jgi:hypothetical protein
MEYFIFHPSEVFVEVQRFRVRQEQLLLVELFGHLPLERPHE